MSGQETRPVPIKLPRGSETILLAEDFVALGEMTKQFLEMQGYTVYTALNGVDALKILEINGSQVDLLFTDVVMPLMGGPELARKVKMLHPQIKVLFTSGYLASALEHYGMIPGHGRLLAKPYSFESLSSRIREVFDAAEMPSF